MQKCAKNMSYHTLCTFFVSKNDIQDICIFADVFVKYVGGLYFGGILDTYADPQ